MGTPNPSLPLWCAAAFTVALSGCNCGRPVVQMTESSIALPADNIEFGVVPEGTSKGAKVHIDNNGRAPVDISVAFGAGSSSDFMLGPVPKNIEAGGFVEIAVIFSPLAAGEDTGTIEVNTVGSTEAPLSVRVHGGPIFPSLAFEPDPVDFRPSTMPLERKTVQLRSVGTAAVTIRSVGVSQTGNPDFSVVPPTVPTRLLPGESVGVRVEYARSQRSTEGLMEVLSDDADAGTKTLRLIPDPPAVCADGLDNDGDGLTDFPDDPGCQDAADSDEANAGSCVNGATQPCGSPCTGTRTCVGGNYGACMITSCPDAGVVDAGSGGCNAAGTYTATVTDGGAMTYACCAGLGIGALVDIDITTFTIQPGSTSVRPTPKQPGTTLPGAAAMCPAGAFTYTKTLPGGCNETYTLTGNFTGPNTFIGTYSAVFTGNDCVGNVLCGGDDCLDQTWSISATR